MYFLGGRGGGVQSPQRSLQEEDSLLAALAATASAVAATKYPLLFCPGLTGTRSTGSITPSMIHISLLESWPLRLLKSVLVPAMALGVAKEKKASFYYRFGNTDEVRDEVGDKEYTVESFQLQQQ